MNQIKLTGAEILKLFLANDPDTKAMLVSQKLSSHIFIYSVPDVVEKMYVLQQNLTYKGYELTKDNLYPIITKIISESFKVIDGESLQVLRDKFEKKKDYNAFITKRLSNDEISSYEPQLKHYL